MSDSVPDSYIDPEDFPFTEEEVRQALLLVGSEADAARLAAEIAALPAQNAEMVRDAEAARARGSQVPEEIAFPSWYVSDGIFALLWCVPALSTRADELIERRWTEWAESLTRDAMLMRGLPTSESPPAEVVREVRRKLSPYRGAWTRRKRALAARLECSPSSAGDRRSGGRLNDGAKGGV